MAVLPVKKVSLFTSAKDGLGITSSSYNDTQTKVCTYKLGTCRNRTWHPVFVVQQPWCQKMRHSKVLKLLEHQCVLIKLSKPGGKFELWTYDQTHSHCIVYKKYCDIKPFIRYKYVKVWIYSNFNPTHSNKRLNNFNMVMNNFSTINTTKSCPRVWCNQLTAHSTEAYAVF